MTSTALVTAGSLLALLAVTFATGVQTGKHSVMDVAWGAGIAVAGGQLPGLRRARRPESPVAARRRSC